MNNEYKRITLANGAQLTIVYRSYELEGFDMPFVAEATAYLPAVYTGGDDYVILPSLRLEEYLMGEKLEADWGIRQKDPPPTCITYPLWRSWYEEEYGETPEEARQKLDEKLSAELKAVHVAAYQKIAPVRELIADVIRARLALLDDKSELLAKAIIHELTAYGFTITAPTEDDDE